jgi:hypothetical protein
MQSKDTNLDLIRKEFEKIITDLTNNINTEEAIHSVENMIFRELLHVGKSLYQHYLNDIFRKSKVQNKEHGKSGLKNCGVVKRELISIFGAVEIIRYKFYDKIDKKEVYPFDTEHQIGASKYSHTLQDLIGKSATDNTFDESVSDVNRIFGLNLAAMQSERIATKMSENVEIFYEQKDYSHQEEGKFFAAGFDDKGVPIRAGSLGREANSNGTRLGKGQKRDVQRHSTVSVTYSFNERCRTPEEVISSLFKEKKEVKIEPLEKQTTAQHKHIRAFMNDKEKAIEYGFNQILKRNGGTSKPIVVLIDGDRGLEHAVNRVAERMKLTDRIDAKVLDFIHVTEYVWKAANVHFGEKNSKRETWVKQQSKLLLESETEKVIETLNALLQEHQGKSGKLRDLESVIRYFTNHKHMMNYAYYLKNGYPISTGAVESACGHFVQNRMQRNGMHWSPNGAQNMLNLRAVNKNDEWDEFMKFYIEEDYKKAA